MLYPRISLASPAEGSLECSFRAPEIGNSDKLHGGVELGRHLAKPQAPSRTVNAAPPPERTATTMVRYVKTSAFKPTKKLCTTICDRDETLGKATMTNLHWFDALGNAVPDSYLTQRKQSSVRGLACAMCERSRPETTASVRSGMHATGTLPRFLETPQPSCRRSSPQPKKRVIQWTLTTDEHSPVSRAPPVPGKSCVGGAWRMGNGWTSVIPSPWIASGLLHPFDRGERHHAEDES